MQHTIAILDTSALMSLFALDLLPHLNLFYQEVLVPRKVEEEFLTRYPDSNISESERYNFLEKHYTEHSSWFKRCVEYGSDLIAIYSTLKGLDDGESEVFAQNQSLENLCCLILDDQKARRFAEQQNYTKCGFLSILAKMDIVFNCCKYIQALEQLKTKRNFYIKEKLAKQIYEDVKKSLL